MRYEEAIPYQVGTSAKSHTFVKAAAIIRILRARYGSAWDLANEGKPPNNVLLLHTQHVGLDKAKPNPVLLIVGQSVT